MDNEIPVEQNAPEVVENDTQAADAPAVGGESTEEVFAADLYSDKPAEGTVDKPAADEQLPQVNTQKDFNAALSQRLAGENTKGYNRAKAEYEASPELQLVRAMIADRARSKGITEQQALAELQNDRIRQQAENYAKNPAQFYMDMLQGNFNAQKPQQQSVEAQSTEMARQMVDAIRAGEIPQGFDVHNLPTDFMQTYNEYGNVRMALRVWQAEHKSDVQAQQIANELQRRQKAPKPMSPTSANPAQPAPPDYAHMSSKQFNELAAKIEQAALQGKKVRL